MWILILTMALNYGKEPAITSVPGFTSLEACELAGKRWLDQQPKYSEGRRYTLCVKLNN